MEIVLLAAVLGAVLFFFLRARPQVRPQAVDTGESTILGEDGIVAVPQADFVAMIEALDNQAKEMRALSRRLVPDMGKPRRGKAVRPKPSLDLAPARALLRVAEVAAAESYKVQMAIIIEPAALERRFDRAVERHGDALDDLRGAVAMAKDAD